MDLDADLGGEAACWLHLVEEPVHDIVDRVDVADLVRTFYRHVAMDDVLGPVFHAAHVDWSEHVPKLTDFWAWVLLGEPGYDGTPLRAHEPIHARMPFRDAHYERWLDLFETTVDELFAGEKAQEAKRRARTFARALRRVLDG